MISRLAPPNQRSKLPGPAKWEECHLCTSQIVGRVSHGCASGAGPAA